MAKATDRKRKSRGLALHYFMIHCKPAPKSKYSRYGGAYVSCWVNFPDGGGALALAKFNLRDSGWRVQRVEEHRFPTRSDYLSHPQLKFFDEALADGWRFLFHTYPKERRLLRATRRKHVD